MVTGLNLMLPTKILIVGNSKFAYSSQWDEQPSVAKALVGMKYTSKGVGSDVIRMCSHSTKAAK